MKKVITRATPGRSLIRYISPGYIHRNLVQKRTKGWLAMRGMWGRKKRSGSSPNDGDNGLSAEKEGPQKRDILRLDDNDLEELYKAFEASKQDHQASNN